MIKSKFLKPPEPLVWTGPAVFLAGSIEMGVAAPWQAEAEVALSDLAVTVLNPRRDHWDPSWRQAIDEPQFRGQVEWELEAQERADVIAMFFVPETKAPITLLELGLLTARSGHVVVLCPEGYWRKGNVDVVCDRYSIETVATFAALIEAVRWRVENPR